jgi:hypothetical protein
MIESPVLTQCEGARLEGMDVYDVEPAQLPDLLAERPLDGVWQMARQARRQAGD